MIKVLLVEDDRLVRKSLITSLNWNKFNMEIVGDAKDGEDALAFLEKHEVDLLITDLAMPVMSGIELIRRVKKLYPDIFVVVLSLHQDFEYIQEAMRLGAIDYIAKVELDTDDMDQTLARIHDRILEEQRKDSLFNRPEQTIENGLVMISDGSLEKYADAIKTSIQPNMMFIGTDALLIFIENNNQFHDLYNIMDSQATFNQPLLLIKIENNQTYTVDDIVKMVQKYKEYLLFYEVKQRETISIVNMACLNLQAYHKNDDKHQMNDLKEEIKSLTWVFDTKLLETMLRDMKAMRLRMHKLNELLMMSIIECRRLLSPILSNQNIELPDSFKCWEDVEAWFRQTQKTIYHFIYTRSIPKETYESIFKAIYLIEKNLSANLTTTDIANQVHMSRSHFSVCFKEAVGKTVNEYIQTARIDKAIHYLTYTNENISTIAEKVGYNDPKYFSRVFKKITGLLPSEYKKRVKSEHLSELR